jgi:hypothetical protein
MRPNFTLDVVVPVKKHSADNFRRKLFIEWLEVHWEYRTAWSGIFLGSRDS